MNYSVSSVYCGFVSINSMKYEEQTLRSYATSSYESWVVLTFDLRYAFISSR